MDLKTKVSQTISKYNMISVGDKVLVAVSGGSDSIALLHLLKELVSELNITLHVFHLNHLLRGPAAERDANFVRQLAAKWQIPITVLAYDVRAYAKRKKLSIEEGAREIRYQLLKETAEKINAQRIALGHQADDQIETFLMRLIRGTGLLGLTAIPPVRERFIRPLIEVTKQEIEEYCQNQGLEYRIDASNEDLSFLRNRIRHVLIPQLIKYNPDFCSTVLKTIEILREEQVFLDNKTRYLFNQLAELEDKILRIGIEEIKVLPVAIQRRLIRSAISWVKSNLKGIEFKHIEYILSKISEKEKIVIELPGNLLIFDEYGYLVFCRKTDLEVEKIKPVALQVPGVTEIKELKISLEAKLISKEKVEIVADRNIAFLDAKKLSYPLILRFWEKGDSFKPLGMRGEKKLQDFFVDEKIPRRVRQRVPLIESGGKIVWLVGYRIDDRYKVTAKTTQVVQLMVKTSGN
jgi:tRNA(Ile)-lysidine synthase